jgi:purine-cytosine permease-like protein
MGLQTKDILTGWRQILDLPPSDVHSGAPVESGPVGRLGFMDNFWNWFGDSANASSWYFGGLLALSGLPFLLGNIFLLTPLIILPWASLAYISRKTGASTVMLARPVLGVVGARMFLGPMETLVQLGWTTVTTYMGATSILALMGLHGFGATVSSLLFIAILQGTVVAFGLPAIRLLKWVSSVGLLFFAGWESWIVLEKWGFAHWPHLPEPSSPLSPGALVDISFINIWTWLQVGDFARHATSRKSATQGAFWGLWTGQTWFVGVGAISMLGLAVSRGHFDMADSDPGRMLSGMGLGFVALGVILLSSISVSASNLYGAGMGLSSLFPEKDPENVGKSLRAVSITQGFTAFLPLLFSSFLSYFTSFLTTIGGIFIPLWSIVLTDYFFCRKGQLSRDDFAFGDDRSSLWGGRGGFNPGGFLALGLGVAFFYAARQFFPAAGRLSGFVIPTIILSSVCYFLIDRFRKTVGCSR